MFVRVRVPPVRERSGDVRVSEATLMPCSNNYKGAHALRHADVLERLVHHKARTQSKACDGTECILVGNSLGCYMLLSMARLCASPHIIFSSRTSPSFLSHISSISDMSQPSSSSNIQILFDAALRDYKDKTGNSLIDHPIAKQLETCESVDSITAVLQEQARRFREFRESDGRLMKALNSSVDVLCAPSISSALNEAIGLVVRRKAFTGVPFS